MQMPIRVVAVAGRPYPRTSAGVVFIDEFGMKQEHRKSVALTEQLLGQDLPLPAAASG